VRITRAVLRSQRDSQRDSQDGSQRDSERDSQRDSQRAAAVLDWRTRRGFRRLGITPLVARLTRP
jgi:hypothetical protein